MQFKSFDDFISYMQGKDFALLNFEITDIAPANTECPTGECDVVTTDPVAVAPELVPAKQVVEGEKVVVTFNSFFDKPELMFESASESVLVVEEYTSIPNACSTTKINLKDREITVGICESVDGHASAKFDVTANGKTYYGKKFKIVSDKTQKNTISLDD